jgi:hypothetical protein
MPVVAGRRSRSPQVVGNRPTKFQEPTPDSFVGNIETAFREQIFNVSIAQSESSVKPHGMANHLRWKAVAFEGDVLHLEMLLWHGIQTPVC